MSDASAFVEEAAVWAKNLVRAESRGPGDHSNAMRRVARRLRVPFSAVWRLHYRKPKSIGAEIFCALGEGIHAMERRYAEERRTLEAATPLGRALLRAADYLAQDDAGEAP